MVEEALAGGPPHVGDERCMRVVRIGRAFATQTV